MATITFILVGLLMVLNVGTVLSTTEVNRVAHCSIEVQAYCGNTDLSPTQGFVKLNGAPVWQSSWQGPHPNRRGVNVILVHPFTCSVQESQHFDTHADVDAAGRLRVYLERQSRYYIIVGVTGDEPTRYLTSALPTLTGMGADVTDVELRGTFAFVAQRGFPAKTVLRKAQNSQLPAAFKAIVTGCSVDYFSITAM